MSVEVGTITVCVVNDERDALELTAARLERESDRITVLTASTVEEGLDVFAEGDVDCIVSDYHMDGANGVEFLERVREVDPEFPFILFTRTGNERIASEAISAGVTDYVLRGFTNNQYELLADKIVRDVERRRAQQEAERTERRLHEIAEHARDALWMFSADWSELLFVNSAYERIFGHSVEALTERPESFLEQVHEDDRTELAQAMERVSEGESARVTYRIPRPDGPPRWAESQGEPISEDGAVVRVVGFTRDVTERMRYESELEEKNEQLDLFTSVVAHDLRNPLNVAQGYLELAQAEGNFDRLASVARAHDRMEQLITDLLTLAREGSEIDERVAVDLRSLVEKHWENVVSGDATLRVEGTATLRCDPSRLGQAFENLFRNSVEHGDRNVTVTVGLLDDGEGFYVEDDGPGIPEEARESLLRGEYEAGTGKVKFGVAIVDRILEAHGWTVEITDAEGGGARFEVRGVDFDD